MFAICWNVASHCRQKARNIYKIPISANKSVLRKRDIGLAQAI
jgi:hypothetical protein